MRYSVLTLLLCGFAAPAAIAAGKTPAPIYLGLVGVIPRASLPCMEQAQTTE